MESTPELDEMEREARLAAYDGDDQIVTASDMREELKHRKKNKVHFSSGLLDLDKLTQGYEGGEFIAISGPTKNGKTLLAQTMTAGFAKAGIKSLWISFEVPIPQFLDQMPEEVEFFIPKKLKPSDADWLEDRIIEAKLKNNVRAVFIDHLHYIIDLESRGKHVSIDIGRVIRRIKRLAVRHNIVIFLLCHATKALTPTGEIRELGAFDIRDSSFVTQEADSTFIVQRKMDKETKEYTNQAMVKVCNHRRTGVMDARTTVEKRGLLFAQPWAKDDDLPDKMQYYGDTLDGGSGDDSIPF